MENYNNQDINRLNMETSKRLAEQMGNWGGVNSMNNPVAASYLGQTAQMLKESNNSDLTTNYKPKTSFSFGVSNTVSALKNSTLNDLPAGKILLEKYENLLFSRGISEAFLIEGLIEDLKNLSWENSVASPLKNLNDIFENRRREVEVVKAYETIRTAPGKELFSDATEQMKNWLVSENRSSDTLIHGLRRFGFNPIVRDLVNFVSLQENKNTGKFHVGFDNDNCEVTNIYTPIEVNENGAIFYTNGKFLEINSTETELSEVEPNELSESFISKTRIIEDRDVKITSDRISLNLGRNRVDFVYEGEDKKIYLDSKQIAERDLPAAISVTTNNLLGNNSNISRAIFISESIDDIVDLEFGKKIRSKVYEGVEANIFKVGGKIYVQTVNPAMRANRIFECNSTQAVNIIKDFLKYDISESLTEFLENEDAFLSVMRNDRNEIIKNITVLESELQKIEEALVQNPLLARSTELQDLKESIEDEVTVLKDKWNKVNLEIKSFEGGSKLVSNGINEDIGYSIDTEIRVKRNGVKGKVIGVDNNSKTYTVLFKEGKTGEYFFSDVEDINDEVDNYSIQAPDMDIEETNEAQLAQNFSTAPGGKSHGSTKGMKDTAKAGLATAPSKKISGSSKFIEDENNANFSDVTKVKGKKGLKGEAPKMATLPKNSTKKGSTFVDSLDNLNLASAPKGNIKGSSKFIDDLKNQQLATLKESQKNSHIEKAPKGKDENAKRFAEKEENANLAEAPGDSRKNGKSDVEDLKRAGLSEAPTTKKK